MTTLRTAAQQVLEAWDGGDTEWFKRAYSVMDALRAALADQNRGWYTVDEINAKFAPDQVLKPEPPPEAQTEAEKIAYCAGWWAALEKARKAEPVMKPAGVITSMVKGGVTWHIWPDQMPDGTTLYAAAPIIKPEIKEDKPFGYFRAEPFGWTDCAPTDEGAIPLYDRPQAQQFLYSAWAR